MASSKGARSNRAESPLSAGNVDSQEASHLLFDGVDLLVAGDLLTVALALKQHPSNTVTPAPLVFEVASGRQMDIDIRGSKAVLKKRFQTDATLKSATAETLPPAKGRGRPRLGVVGREVTLLPRHWQWLEQQRGGASAALRRLVDQARAQSANADRSRESQDRCHHFISVLAGDLPGYEEATRALFAGDRESFTAHTRRWPKDVRHYARAFAADALTG